MKFISIEGQLGRNGIAILAAAAHAAFPGVKWERLDGKQYVSCYSYSWLMSDAERTAAVQIIGEFGVFIPQRIVRTANSVRIIGTHEGLGIEGSIDILHDFDGDHCDYTPIDEVPYEGEPVMLLFKVF